MVQVKKPRLLETKLTCSRSRKHIGTDSCCSVGKSYLMLCDPMDCSTPGFPVLHHLPEFAQTHVHSVHDAIQLNNVEFQLDCASMPSNTSFPSTERTSNTNGLGDPSYSEQGKGSLGTSHEATGLKRAPWRRRRSIRQQPRVEVWSIDYSLRFWVSVPVLFLFTCVKWEKLVHFYVPQFPCL